jgi:hypothetical protein
MKLWEAGEQHLAPPDATLPKEVKKKRTKPKKIKARPSKNANTTSTSSSSTSGSVGRNRAPSGGNNHWGRAMDVYGDADYNGGVLDKNDPNYDSTEESAGGFYMQGSGSTQTHGYGDRIDSSPPRNAYKTLRQPPPTSVSLSEYKRTVIQFLKEYFVSGDRLEVERCMRDAWMPDFHFEMVKRTITMAMDRNARGCEAASLLLSFLYGRRMITTDEFGKGIERLFEVIGESTNTKSINSSQAQAGVLQKCRAAKGRCCKTQQSHRCRWCW